MSVSTYSKRAIWIHWLSALLILATIPTGLAMSETEASPTKLLLYQLHFVIGMLVFFLAIFHVYVYFQDERPEKVDTGNAFRNKFVEILHRVLTILIFILTITGVASLFTTPIWEAVQTGDETLLSKSYPSLAVSMHHLQGIIFMFLCILHIGGVMLHRFSRGKGILHRMGLKW